MTAEWLAARAQLETALGALLASAQPVADCLPALTATAFATPAGAPGEAVSAARREEQTLLEHALCRVLDGLMREAAGARALLMEARGEEVRRLLAAGLSLCQAAAIEPGVVYTLLEQLLEGSTVPDCGAVVAWMEAHREALKGEPLWQRGKLILLRACNELTRRLSRAAHAHVVLCGRVLLLLAGLFALSERSALNAGGAYNRGNVTVWEAREAAASGLEAGAEAEEGELINEEFYDSVWRAAPAPCHPLNPA